MLIPCLKDEIPKVKSAIKEILQGKAALLKFWLYHVMIADFLVNEVHVLMT
ncbi:hypothetical protein V6M85_03275 [Sulfolobus tengchongensis]|uniref:Uncharacterized protein n=1 Tax=Sulfolobus tengchongensis TaxID=207809 RepID=A0AAX4L3Y4_9CREN